MVEQNKNAKSDFDPLWARLDKQGDEVNRLSKMTAALETGQDRLTKEMERQFKAVHDAISMLNKPPVPMIQVATFSLLLAGAFASVIVYMSTQASQGMMREIDLRIKGVEREEDLAAKAFNAAIAMHTQKIEDIHARMLIDDKREQQDMYDKGFADARMDALEQNFYHLDDQLHIRHRIDEAAKIDHQERLGRLEEHLEMHKRTKRFN